MLMYILPTSFLAYGPFVTVFQLFKSFPMVCSMTIFTKKNLTLWGSGFKIRHFCIFAEAEAVCTPTMAACVFISSYYPMSNPQ